jgi:hypothetical protein
MSFYRLNEIYGPRNASQIKALWAGVSARGMAESGELWLDTSSTPCRLKRYNGSTWDIIGDLTATEILTLLRTVDGGGHCLANIWNASVEPADPYLGLTLEEARAYKLRELKWHTYNMVTHHMPEWKQMKWKEYLHLYEKKQSSEKLFGFEELTFASFPIAGETTAFCYRKVQQGLKWVLLCVRAHNHKEVELFVAKDIAAIKKIGLPDYPAFPL